jgi:hypothetical protein
MFSRVLVATDLSAASDGALHCTKGVIPLGAKEAVLVHAIGIQHLNPLAPSPPPHYAVSADALMTLKPVAVPGDGTLRSVRGGLPTDARSSARW